MPTVTAPADTITLSVDGQQIECQVRSHTLSWSDPTSGDIQRSGCGDVVNVPADSVEVGTLDLTVWDDRAPAGFAVWTRIHHGEVADFTLVENYGEPAAAVEYSGKVVVAAVPVAQTDYTKIETVDVSWAVTEFATVGVTPTP